MGEDRPTAEKMLEMAGGDEDFDGEDGYDDEGGGGKRLLMMIVLPLLLLVGGAAGAYFSGLADPLLSMLGGEEPEVVEGEAEPSGTAPADRRAPVGSAIFYDLPEMLVNLDTPGGKRNFLKILVSLELEQESDITAIESVLPRIVDNFQVYLREMRLEDLQGRDGIFRLRAELRDRVNTAVSPIEVSDVLFKEMIVQ